MKGNIGNSLKVINYVLQKMQSKILQTGASNASRYLSILTINKILYI